MSPQFVALRDFVNDVSATKIPAGTLVDVIGGGPLLDIFPPAEEKILAVVKDIKGKTYVVNPIGFVLATNRMWMIRGTQLVNILSGKRRPKPMVPAEWTNHVLVFDHGKWIPAATWGKACNMAVTFVAQMLQD